MNRDDFIDVYMRMSTAQREQLDELIEEKIEKEQQLDDLQAKLDQLTPEQLADAEDSQDEFIKNMAEEEQEITGAEYSVDDPEEAEQLRQVDWANLRDEQYARLVEDFPAGILIIEDELEKIEDDMRSLVPIKK